MSQSSPSVSAVRRSLAALAVAAAVLSPVVTATAAGAATGPGAEAAGAATGPGAEAAGRTPRSDLTAGVRSIDHGLGIVTLVGTGPIGGSVGITGDGVTETWTEASRDGAWTAAVRVRSGERVLHVSAPATGQEIDVPVSVLVLTPPEMTATVDGVARTISIEGSGQPSAHFVIKDDDETVGETDADADGAWSFTLRDLAFGDHHVEAWQYFDGTHNGGVDEVYTVSGAAIVSTATASRETDRVSLAGRAPVGTTLRFSDADGPVREPDGRPVTATAAPDTSWSAELPIPAEARFWTVTVTTSDGADELGTTEARVTVPLELRGTVEVLTDGSVRLAGTGEIGGVVSLEAEDGTPLESTDGYPIATTIGRGWELTVPRALLPADVVVARQWVDGVGQGAVRLVLPELPVRPAPGPDPDPAPGPDLRPGPGPSAGAGDGAGSGHRAATGAHPARQHGVAGRASAASSEQLAATGADPSRSLGAAGALLVAGSGALVAGRRLRRRGARRD